MTNHVKSFIVGVSFMSVFGFIDNLVLLLGMGVTQGYVMKMGFDAEVAAGIGNTLSDMVGVLVGGVVSAGLYKVLKVKDRGTTLQSLLGVAVGCMIPLIFKILFL